MKKGIFLIMLAVLILAPPCFSTERAVNKLITAQNTWVIVDNTTSDGNEPNDLTVDERTYNLVVDAIATAKDLDASGSEGDGEISIFYPIPKTYNAGRFRCSGVTESNSVIHQIYLGTLGGGADCELVKAGQLAWTIGTQVSTVSTYEMADAVTVTPYCWTKSWDTASPSGNLVAEASVDFMGADILVVVTSTSECNSKLLLKGF